MTAAPLPAQQGDKAGEEQPPRPAHWVVPPAPSLSAEEQAKTFTLAPGFRSNLMWKDIKLALGTGVACGAYMPVTALGAQKLAALCASGRAELDNASMGLLFEDLSGIKR